MVKYFFILLVLLSSNGLAQDNLQESIHPAFNKYQVNNLQEKVFIHTNKTFYLAGEIIWFKAYVADASFHKPLDLSKVMYVEIIDNKGKSVLQAKIKLENAMGQGSFLIPHSMNSGNFILRAYTKYMRNFSADFFFHQEITIVNTLIQTEPTHQKISHDYDIRFFPEGGNLVYGIPSKMAFKVVDNYGKYIDCNGVLLNQKNDTVLKFATLKFGMGNFSFTPNHPESYYAKIQLPDTVIIEKINGIKESGFVLQLQNPKDSLIDVKVICSPEYYNKPVSLFIHSGAMVTYSETNVINETDTHFFVNKNILSDGISHFTIFNAENIPVCERLFFQKPNHKLLINLKADQELFHKRKPVTININTTENNGKVSSANMSVSVFQIDSLQPGQYEHIDNYFLLSSELKGRIEAPEYYFESNDHESTLAADNLMLTQGWSRFNWEDIIHDRNTAQQFLPELEGLRLDAKVSNLNNADEINKWTAFLSVPDKNFIFNTSVVNPEGKASFTTNQLYGQHAIIMQCNNGKDKFLKLELLPDFESHVSSSQSISKFDLPVQFANILLRRSINVQAENAYRGNIKNQLTAFENTDSTAFYGLPDKRYHLDNYTRFITMEEVIKEYIKEIHLRKHEGDYEMKLLNSPMLSYFNRNPLVLLDGLPIFKTNNLIAFNPLKVKTIDIVSQKYFLGKNNFDGIVSLRTYAGDLGGYPIDQNAVMQEYEGLQNYREFYSPVYDSQINERIPDFRNQLYWQPNLNTTTNGTTNCKFFTSDLKGKFAIVVQGISPTGLAGSKIIYLNVE